jgi:hypothetical protein
MLAILAAVVLSGSISGKIITFTATATYEDAFGTHESDPASCSVVVIAPMLQSQLYAHGVRAVYAPGAVRRWRASEADEWTTWTDPCLPGLREIRILNRRSVEGIATKGGGFWVLDHEVTPAPAPAPAPAAAGAGPLPAITLLEEVLGQSFRAE